MSDDEVRLIEKALVRLDGELAPADVECNVCITVSDIGQWMIKFRRNGITTIPFHCYISLNYLF